MDKLAAIETFHAIADNGTLTAAASRLQKSLPTVVRTLAQLEEELGARLFNRTTRRIDLTEEGAVYLAETRRLLANLDAVEARVSGRESQPAGHVIVTAPVFFGERVVSPLLPAIRNAHPALSMRLRLSDRIEDLVEGHIDIAVRIGHLTSSDLIRLKVGEVRQVLCATPEFLGRTSPPTCPSDLKGQSCIETYGNSGARSWRFQLPDGKVEAIEIPHGLAVNTARAARAACLAGAGFGLFLSYQVAADIREGRLVRLLPEFEPEPQPVQLVHAAGRMPAQRIQTVWRALEEGVGKAVRDIALDS